MKVTVAVGIATAVLAGCTSATIVPDFRYASTPQGILNDGLFRQGQLFLWDPDTNIVQRSEIVPFPANADFSGTPTNQVVRNIRNVGFSASLSAPVQAAAAFKIETSASINLQNASREDYNDTISLLSAAINRQAAAGIDVGSTWSLRQATAAGSNDLYIFVRGVTLASSAEFSAGGVVGGSLEVEIPGGPGGGAEVKLDNSALSSCAAIQGGARTPCFISVYVLDPSVSRDGLYHFEPVPERTQDEVARALKASL